MKFRFHPLARAKLVHAVEHYEECEPGLGLAFTEEVHAAVIRLTRNPEAWSPFTTRTRRCFIKRFPFSIIYHIKFGYLEIVAVANSHRRPGYWIDRLSENKAPYETEPSGTTGRKNFTSRNEAGLP
jgi:hypothetical protein